MNQTIIIKAAALALLAGGIALTIFGVDAMNSANSDISRFFTGAPTDRTMWLLVGGIVMLVAGLAGLLSASRKS
jgi:uncharacterized membrane protein YidH (DUF202 family)